MGLMLTQRLDNVHEGISQIAGIWQGSRSASPGIGFFLSNYILMAEAWNLLKLETSSLCGKLAKKPVMVVDSDLHESS